MAKEFKEYDKKYHAYKGKLLPYEEAALGIMVYRPITYWHYREDMQSHAAVWIAKCVYGDASSDEWQKFRVALKGSSTEQKLIRLEYRYELFVLKAYNGAEQARKERCRIDNYIQALKRGGYLNAKYEVVK